jgi:WD40 repeat protein
MDATSTNPPFFSALEPRAWSTNRLYRVHVLPHELVCVWAGSGNEIARALAVQGGLVGGLLAAAASPARKNAARQEELDAKPLEEQREDHKHNFAILLEDVEEAEVVPASFWFRITYSNVAPVGLLRLRCRDRGPMTLALTTKDDVRRVLQLLPSRLGDKIQVGLSWDDRRRGWVACPLSRRFTLPPDEETAAPQGLPPPPVNVTASPPSARGPGPGSFQAERFTLAGYPSVEEPEAARPQSAAGTVALCLAIAVLLLGGAAAVVWLLLVSGGLRQAGPQGQNKANSLPIDGNNPRPLPAKNWQQFTSPEAGFTASFPGAPQHTSRRASNSPRTIHVFEVQDAGDSYSIVTALPPQPGKPSHLFQTLKVVRDDFPLGRIDPEKPVKLGAYQGWEFVIRFVDRTVVQRVLHGHGRSFTLRVVSPRLGAIADDAQHFFDSFRPAGADEPSPNPGQPAAFQPPPKRLKGSVGELLSLAFTGDGKTVMAASQNGEFLTWDSASADRTGAAAFPEPPVRFLAFATSPDGKTAAASTLNGAFDLLDTETLRPKAVLVNRLDQGVVWSVAFSPDGTLVAAGHGQNVARLWNVAQQTAERELRGDRPVQSVAFTPDGKTLAVGGPGSTVTLWDVNTGAARATLKGSPSEVPSAGAVWALACSPDGKTLAAGGNDQTVRLWDLDTRTERAILKHTETVRSLAFSPDGKLLATGDDAGSVALWDAANGSRLALLPAEKDPCSIRALAFSPGTPAALAATCGNEVRLWDLAEVRRGGAPGGR